MDPCDGRGRTLPSLAPDQTPSVSLTRDEGDAWLTEDEQRIWARRFSAASTPARSTWSRTRSRGRSWLLLAGTTVRLEPFSCRPPQLNLVGQASRSFVLDKRNDPILRHALATLGCPLDVVDDVVYAAYQCQCRSSPRSVMESFAALSEVADSRKGKLVGIVRQERQNGAFG